MVAGDESEIVELIIGGKAVAPALVLRGDDETLIDALEAAYKAVKK